MISKKIQKKIQKKRLLVWLFCLFSAAWVPIPSRAEVLEFAVIGDAGNWNSSSQAVFGSIQKTKIRSLILPGDNLYHPESTYEANWGPWLKGGFKFDIVAIGNHNGGYAQEMAYFNMPGEYFSVVKGSVRFLILNSDNVSTAEVQAGWLEKELKASKQKFNILVLHHPPYQLTRTHSSMEKIRFHKAIRAVIWKNRSRVTTLLLGHDHIASLAVAGDLPLVVSGAVHDLRHEAVDKITDGDREVKNLWFYPGTPHWTLLKIDSDRSRVEVTFVDAAKGPLCTVRLKPDPIKLGSECSTFLGK